MKLGIDRLEENLDFFKGKRVGLITNPTGFTSNFISTMDLLKDKVNLVALFGPEHSVRGDFQDGVNFDDYIDSKTGIKVFSLYSKVQKPTKEMMDEIDVLCIDIQDGGSRFYTFITTMAYSMMACQEYNKEFVVFDRPNPAGGISFEGNILDTRFRSFVGYYPMVQRHGMTLAELAYLFNEEYGIHAKLKLILMEGWKREMYYEDTKLLWIMPSPNFPTPLTSIVYNGTCIFEGTNVSEGRGTTAPFQIIGSPYINPFDYAKAMNDFNFDGVYFRPLYFTPTFSKHAKALCGGVEVHVLNRKTFSPVKVGWAMLEVIRNMYPDDFKVLPPWKIGNPTMLEYNTGSDYIINRKYSLEEQFKILEEDTFNFGKIREKYLLY